MVLRQRINVLRRANPKRLPFGSIAAPGAGSSLRMHAPERPYPAHWSRSTYRTASALVAPIIDQARPACDALIGIDLEIGVAVVDGDFLPAGVNKNQELVGLDEDVD